MSNWPAAALREAAIAGSRSRDDLDAAIRGEPYDYSPPTDERPYFFNMLRPASLLHPMSLRNTGIMSSAGLVAAGNLLATITLVMLAGVSACLVASMIIWPLWRSGVPAMPTGTFASALLYFSLIGIGFMMVQIPYMQRFSVYLGHPTYAIAVILFSMILCTGIGSALSDRLAVEKRALWVIVVPLSAAAVIAVATELMQPLIDTTVRYGLGVRSALVFALTAPPSLLLGVCFPTGMRLVRPLSERAMPWMWGVNGACGVLASVLAVAISIWAGIDASLHVAVACYATLPLPGWWLRRVHRPAEDE